jgi:hypothetical protein
MAILPIRSICDVLQHKMQVLMNYKSHRYHIVFVSFTLQSHINVEMNIFQSTLWIFFLELLE